MLADDWNEVMLSASGMIDVANTFRLFKGCWIEAKVR
jgi:hypothetical protein